MVLAVQVPGPALIKIDANQGSSLESLGYTINGADVDQESFMSDVPGDQNGGDEGPPIDIQYLGEIARVRLELSKWDATVAAKVLAIVPTGTAGAVQTAGTLLFGTANSYYRLLIVPQTDTTLVRNFIAAIPRHVQSINLGTKFARLQLEFECHAVSGVLWNATTS